MPYFQRAGVTLYCGDALAVLSDLEPVDLVLTDPPYGISLEGVSHKKQPGRGTRLLDFWDSS